MHSIELLFILPYWDDEWLFKMLISAVIDGCHRLALNGGGSVNAAIENNGIQ